MSVKSVGWLALGMFAWGLLKARTVGKRLSSGCPICAEQSIKSPRHAVHSLVVGPVVEELQFRQTLPRLIGDTPSAALFGAAHMSRGLSVKGNALRALEAGLAGGVIYAEAYSRDGLLGAALVHAAHNLGADLGLASVMRDRVREEGWVRESRPTVLRIGPHEVRATITECRRLGRPLKVPGAVQS